jgi:hypothetical protein
MHFVNQSGEQLKVCIYQNRWTPRPDGVVLLGAGAPRYWNPPPSTPPKKVNVRLFVPATLDILITQVDGVDPGSEVVITSGRSLVTHDPVVKEIDSLNKLVRCQSDSGCR